MKAIIILSHGSKSKNSNKLPEKVALELEQKLKLKTFIANLQLSEPYLNDVVEKAYKDGYRNFIIHPFFLHKGVHVEEDIPKILDSLKKKYDDASFIMTDVTGEHPSIINAALEVVREAL